jgi:hypothetical protein
MKHVAISVAVRRERGQPYPQGSCAFSSRPDGSSGECLSGYCVNSGKKWDWG